MTFDLTIALRIAWDASRRIMDLRRSPLDERHKADRSLVTNADHEADRILREGLRREYPSHAVLTEESGLQGPEGAEFVWLVDPIDGTRAYAKGIPGFSVMVGLLKEGRPYAGIVVDPSEQRTYAAVRGGGALLIEADRRQSLAVSRRRHLEDMPVVTSTGFPEALARSLSHRLPGAWQTPINSVGIKVGILVRGLADIYINHHTVHYWDTCAPLVILEEAGGTMTYLGGEPLDYALVDGRYQHLGPTVATNGERHREVLDAVRAATPPLV